MANEEFFSEFESFSKADWLAQIEKDLKGKKPKDLFKKWQDLEVEPFKDKSDRAQSSYSFRAQSAWLIRQSFCIDSPKDSNKEILLALNEGVNNLEISNISDADSLNQALAGVDFSFIRTDLKLGDWLMNGAKEAFQKLAEDKEISGSWNFDPLNKRYKDGDFYASQAEDMAFINQLAKSELKNFHLVEVNTAVFHNQGAYAITELAIGLAMFNEYLGFLSEPEKNGHKVNFSLGLGVNYFLELAKIRSFRKLVKSVASEYQSTEEHFINAETGTWSITASDRHNNILRASTQAMAAAIGGADSISILGHDLVLNSERSFAKHIARMQHQMLAEESFLDRVYDPVSGSYFIESLGEELEAAAWKKFQEIESVGGYLQAVENGLIKSWVQSDRAEQLAQLESGELTSLGVNLYSNEKEDLDLKKLRDFDRLSKGLEKDKTHG